VRKLRHLGELLGQALILLVVSVVGFDAMRLWSKVPFDAHSKRSRIAHHEKATALKLDK